jgi:hypothetical protein
MADKKGWRWQVYLVDGVGEYRESADNVEHNKDGSLALYNYIKNGKELTCVVGKGYWKFVRYERTGFRDELAWVSGPGPGTIKVED